MSTGIRVEVSVSAPERCPVAATTEGGDTRVHDVTRVDTGDGSSVEEFTAEGPVSETAHEVFERDGGSVYRFDRPTGWNCVCEVVESVGSPVADVEAADGTLDVTFHADDGEAARAAIQRLQEDFDGVTVDRVLRSADETGNGDAVVIDRDRLTDRQQEVLATAKTMGYFEYPRRSNAAEVAAALDISPSTFSEHLAAAQGKLLDDVFE